MLNSSQHPSSRQLLRTTVSLPALTLLLTACATPQLPAGPQPLDPIAFFTGPTRGEGELLPLVGSSQRITVESQGVRDRDGALTLTQIIRQGDRSARTRTWIMQPLGPGRYTGSLSDAEGAVDITVTGPRAAIRYRTPSGITIRQQLALQPDGRTILNRLEAWRFGLRLAVLNETIRRGP